MSRYPTFTLFTFLHMTQDFIKDGVKTPIPTSLPVVPSSSALPVGLDLDKLSRLPLEEAVSKMTTYEQLNEFLKHCT